MRCCEISRPAQLAIPARHEHHGAARVHRAEHAVEHAGDVEHRHDAEHDRLRPAGVAPLAADRVVHQRAMRVHAALRQAGRARGVGQQREIVGAGAMRARARDRAPIASSQRVQPAGSGGSARSHASIAVGRRVGRGHLAGGRHRVGVARRDDRAHALVLGQRGVGRVDDGGEVGAADHDLGAGIADVVLELLGAVHRIDRHDDGVGAQHGVERDRELRAVLHEDGDAVAGRDAGASPASRRARSRRRASADRSSARPKKRYAVRSG